MHLAIVAASFVLSIPQQGSLDRLGRKAALQRSLERQNAISQINAGSYHRSPQTCTCLVFYSCPGLMQCARYCELYTGISWCNQEANHRFGYCRCTGSAVAYKSFEEEETVSSFEGTGFAVEENPDKEDEEFEEKETVSSFEGTGSAVEESFDKEKEEVYLRF